MHSTSAYVEKCIQSVVRQSFKNIEIVCVYDSNSEDALTIVKKYAVGNLNFKIINNETQLSKLAARTKGVEHATGKYILFIDSHDFLDVNACQSIFDLLRKYDTDILQFKCGIESRGREETEQNVSVKRELTVEKLNNSQILDHLFKTDSVSTALVGKAIKTNIAKLASESIKVKAQYPGEEVYYSFFISYYAKTYRFIDSPPLYWIGRQSNLETKTKHAVSLDTFSLYCSDSEFCADIRDFLRNKGDLTKYHHIYEALSRRLLASCCAILKKQISIKDFRAGACYLYNFWKDNPVFDCVVKQFFELKSEQFYRRWVDQKHFVSPSSKY